LSQHQIKVLNNDVLFECGADQPILLAMAKTGQPGIPKGCFGGGCGICRIRVVEGEYTTGKMSRAHINEQEAADGFVLACKCYPQGDLLVELAGKAVRTT